MTTPEILDRIRTVTGHEPRRNGDGWKARCPAHDDRSPSMSVSTGTDGRTLLHCHAGCEHKAIIQALGLSAQDLFADTAQGRPRATTPTPKATKPKRTWASLQAALGDMTPPGGTLAGKWEYPSGYAVARYDLPDGSKTFRPMHQTPDGWACGDPEGLLPLYQGDDLPVDGTIYVAEGEKACDAVASVGLPAVTSPHGSASPRKADWTPLAGRDVVILPDNDHPGRKYADTVGEILMSLSPPARVKVLELDGLPGGGDMVEWIDADGPMGEKTTEEIVERIRALARRLEWLTPPTTEATPEPKPEGDGDDVLTDVSNAARFVAEHGRDVRYCHAMGRWFIWSGKAFERDESGRAVRLAKKTTRNMMRAAADAPDKDSQRALFDHARRTQSRERLNAMLDLARCEVPVTPSELDADAMLLNCLNGSIDLRTGALREHRRADLCTKVAPVNYVADAAAPRWERFLQEITDGDGELQAYLQRLAGLSLTADASEHALFICYGSGANGKSVFTETLTRMMGEYASQAPPGLLCAKGGFGEHPTEVADLQGRRLVTASESDEGGRLKVALMKRLTGDATLRARFMRQDYFEFTRTFKLIFCTNNRPRIGESSGAVWRRIRLVPFAVTIPPERRDAHLQDKLTAEWPGILAWAVRGCLDWQEHGLAEPDAVRYATESYQSEQDTFSQFLADACIIEPQAHAPRGEIYAAYTAWAGENGERYPLSNRAVFERLRSIENMTEKQVRTPAGRVRMVYGIGLLATTYGGVTECHT